MKPRSREGEELGSRIADGVRRGIILSSNHFPERLDSVDYIVYFQDKDPVEKRLYFRLVSQVDLWLQRK